MKKKPKLLVVLGPTAVGKSDLAVELALKHNGEVISADSRQVYTGFDIGTGKITKKEMRGVPHYMLDITTAKKRFDISMWQEKTKKIISEIHNRGKLPIICGGTGFYIQSIVDNIVLPDVPPDDKLRSKLEKKDTEQLVKILQKLDPKIIKTIDTKNPVRLIRAIEIATHLGSVPKIKKEENPYDILQIGLIVSDEVLKERIYIRLIKRMKNGMIREAKKLHEKGISWKKMYQLGLEYRYLSLLIQNKISKTEFIEKLNTEIWHYARRQKQWFKRDNRIKWFEPKDLRKIEKVAIDFLNK